MSAALFRNRRGLARSPAPPLAVGQQVGLAGAELAKQLARGRDADDRGVDVPAAGKLDIKVATAEVDRRDLPPDLRRWLNDEAHIAVVALADLPCLDRHTERSRLRGRRRGSGQQRERE